MIRNVFYLSPQTILVTFLWFKLVLQQSRKSRNNRTELKT